MEIRVSISYLKFVDLDSSAIASKAGPARAECGLQRRIGSMHVI